MDYDGGGALYMVREDGDVEVQCVVSRSQAFARKRSRS